MHRRNSSRCQSSPTSTLSRCPSGSAVTLRSRSPTCSISTRSMPAPHGTQAVPTAWHLAVHTGCGQRLLPTYVRQAQDRCPAPAARWGAV